MNLFLAKDSKEIAFNSLYLNIGRKLSQHVQSMNYIKVDTSATESSICNRERVARKHFAVDREDPRCNENEEEPATIASRGHFTLSID